MKYRELTSKEAAVYLGLSTTALAHQRSFNKSPIPFHKDEFNGRVTYRELDLARSLWKDGKLDLLKDNLLNGGNTVAAESLAQSIALINELLILDN